MQKACLENIQAYSEPEAYSEPCQTCTTERCAKIVLTAIVIFANYNFCNISFSRSPFLKI